MEINNQKLLFGAVKDMKRYSESVLRAKEQCIKEIQERKLLDERMERLYDLPREKYEVVYQDNGCRVKFDAKPHWHTSQCFEYEGAQWLVSCKKSGDDTMVSLTLFWGLGKFYAIAENRRIPVWPRRIEFSLKGGSVDFMILSSAFVQ